MGMRCERRKWGACWSTGMAYTDGLPLDEVPTYLADLRSFYSNQPAHINLDSPVLEASLGPALVAAGGKLGKRDEFLAYVGTAPVLAANHGISIEPASAANVAAIAETRLRAFAASDSEPDASVLADETERRRSEMTGTGGGLLARLDGCTAGMLWWYEEQPDLWINLLGTRAPFRRAGVARTLLCECLSRAYGRGYRSVVINVLVDNSPAQVLYRQLGFTDAVYWRQRYELTSVPQADPVGS
jgi:ribosomal protein S18 acetylase RimI-like enzyme